MTEIPLLPLVARWMHILSAIVAAGGSIFLWGVLRPSFAAVRSNEDRGALRDAVMRRWRPVVHICILLFLLSGFYNYLFLTRLDHTDQPVYHGLFGVKFLLAMAVFGLALALTSRHQWSARLHARGGLWMGLLVAAAVAVVLVSGVMRALPKVPVSEGARAVSQTE